MPRSSNHSNSFTSSHSLSQRNSTDSRHRRKRSISPTSYKSYTTSKDTSPSKRRLHSKETRYSQRNEKISSRSPPRKWEGPKSISNSLPPRPTAIPRTKLKAKTDL
ncbi:hypothetical protein HMI54_013832 [Coelomomyces lativittatus]|nr:hypothetical protein HMI54_013832 [Coelomomyces lativittatus]KAJ1497410.1 hypothetical protein HMI56_005641 [Coelomomyces lativittatus]